MSKRERQKRYRTTGAGANLVKVETLVPPDGRAEILRLAARLRKRVRREGGTPKRPLDVEAVLKRVRELCAAQPRRYGLKSDIDNLITTSVNVPFSNRIDAKTLADALQREQIPEGYGGHLERLLGETPLNPLLRFCDQHGITPEEVRRFVRKHRDRLALHRPDLDEHLDALLPNS